MWKRKATSWKKRPAAPTARMKPLKEVENPFPSGLRLFVIFRLCRLVATYINALYIARQALVFSSTLVCHWTILNILVLQKQLGHTFQLRLPLRTSVYSLASRKSSTLLQMIGCTVTFWFSIVLTLNPAKHVFDSQKEVANRHWGSFGSASKHHLSKVQSLSLPS